MFSIEIIKQQNHYSKKAINTDQHQDDLFLHTAYSVKKEKIPVMRERIQESIYEYLDSEQDEDGDCFQKITLGFYR